MISTQENMETLQKIIMAAKDQMDDSAIRYKTLRQYCIKNSYFYMFADEREDGSLILELDGDGQWNPWGIFTDKEIDKMLNENPKIHLFRDRKFFEILGDVQNAQDYLDRIDTDELQDIWH